VVLGKPSHRWEDKINSGSCRNCGSVWMSNWELVAGFCVNMIIDLHKNYRMSSTAEQLAFQA
jgi:hypothetical protein